MTYYQYFRLKAPPFEAATPDGPVYFSPTHLEGLATLESGLSSELTGLTMLTGEVGTGKTTLIYSLLQRDYKRVRIAHIDDPKLSFPEMMRAILTQLNLYSTGSTKLDYLEALDRFLELRGKEERIAIVVDESQVLSDEVLEELRLLSSRGQRHGRRLQLILVGQPELAERLKKPELRQLNQRISSRGVLKPLSYAQSVKYVECRLLAQGSKCAAIFAPGALKRLLRRSDGIPRKINVLCHSAMLAAFQAGEKKVSFKTAKKVAAEYHDSVTIIYQGFGAQLLRLMPAFVAGTVVASLVLLGFVYSNVRSGRPMGHSVASVGAAEQTARSAQQGKPVKTVQRAAAVEQPGVEAHLGSGAKPKAATPATTHPVELSASLAPAPAAPPAAKSEVAGPTAMRETHIASDAPATVGASAAPVKLALPPPVAPQRAQITVRNGDTLEGIAIRYLGSTSAIDELVAANPQLTNINRLSVGEIIYLPSGITPKAPREETATAPPVSSTQDSAQR